MVLLFNLIIRRVTSTGANTSTTHSAGSAGGARFDVLIRRQRSDGWAYCRLSFVRGQRCVRQLRPFWVEGDSTGVVARRRDGMAFDAKAVVG